MTDGEKGRVVPIRLNERELEPVERFASMYGFSSIGRAVKHAMFAHVLEVLGEEEESDQTLKMTLWKISQMADLALGDHDF